MIGRAFPYDRPCRFQKFEATETILPTGTTIWKPGLRKSNPSVDKYLLNKTSVDNAEWIYISCGKYLIKNKVPPCAAVNGMKFPNKPAFFDLNELEYRLLASRLAFQKLMQAPRGK